MERTSPVRPKTDDTNPVAEPRAPILTQVGTPFAILRICPVDPPSSSVAILRLFP